MNPSELLSGGAGLVVMILAIVLSILWVIMPFAVFGIHTLLKQQVKLMKEAAERERIRDGKARNDGRH